MNYVLSLAQTEIKVLTSAKRNLPTFRTNGIRAIHAISELIRILLSPEPFICRINSHYQAKTRTKLGNITIKINQPNCSVAIKQR